MVLKVSVSHVMITHTTKPHAACIRNLTKMSIVLVAFENAVYKSNYSVTSGLTMRSTPAEFATLYG